ncbi:MAG: glycosyltransferase family 4 protein [Chlamydiota bacterium]|nr:glycosyltransferase family 4 protein [Chlamydiota bacterium]
MDLKRRIAFVIPRYEIGQAGGAEIHAAKLAQQLVKRGHHIEVFTTCARDHHRWDNVLLSGTQEQDGISIHRFETDPKEDHALFLELQAKIHAGLKLEPEEEHQWIRNSVHSRELYRAIEKRKDEFDGIIFMPYLFGMAYEGSKVVPDKFILIPCLHDEPYAYLSIFKEMFNRAKSIFFNTFPEMEIARRIFDLNVSAHHIVALGFDNITPADTGAFRTKFGLGDCPYLLFAGRKEKGKNIPLLIEYFKHYTKNVHAGVKLVLIGSGDLSIPDQYKDDILDFGFVSTEDKLNAIAGSLSFCLPSVNESLSIVLMEAWSQKVPVLVHANCAVTRYHCDQSGGGLYFSNYFEFEEALEWLRSCDEIRNKMGCLGQIYVQTQYSWDAVVGRFEKAFDAYINGSS